MTLTELKYIIAVAQEKNFGRAAEKCFVSQPTLSIAIKKLEDELDLIIFERQKNEVLITAIGERLVEQAQVVWDEANKLKLIARENKQGLQDILKIGAIFTVGPYLFPSLLPKLAKAAPQMPLLIEENYTKQLTKKLLQGELDVIIVAKPYEQAGIETVPLFTEKMFVILPPNHAWRDHAKIDPKALESEQVLLLGEGHCFRDDVLRACPDCGISNQAHTPEEKMVEGSSLETIRHMVASGMGISVLPQSAINKEHYADDYFLIKPFSSPEPVREIVLAYRSGYPRVKVVELLQACLQ
jgi:LysR family hydrogen peroxide-inducible transcriptional activator